MGCDIHAWVERKIDGDWHAIHDLKGAGSYDEWGWGGQRDYDFFAHLAGVRSYVDRYGDDSAYPKPKGLPKDVSKVVKWISDRWDCDGHSHSWDTVKDFVEKKVALAKIRGDHNDSEHSASWYEWKLLGYEILEDENRDDYRVVYFFDN